MFRRSIAVLLAATTVSLIAASGSTANDRPSIVMIGDSVMLGSRTPMVESLDGLGWSVTFDSKVSRTTVEGLETIRTSDALIDDVVVLALGYNNEGEPELFAAYVDQIMSELSDVPKVIWLNMRSAVEHDYASLNAVLAAKQDIYDNLIVADWDTASHRIGNPTWKDGIHLRPEGAAAMRDLVVSTLAAEVDLAQCDPARVPEASASDDSGAGYWLLASDGRVHAYNATQYGDIRGSAASAMAMQASPSGNGYWIVDATGAVTAFGDAVFFGDMSAVRLNAAITSIVANPAGSGYWLLASDGGVFSFGDARFWGSMGGGNLNAPIIALASCESGSGYWLVAADGGVFAFGDATFRGSTGNIALNAPISAMAVEPAGSGYWLYAQDGGVFTFGNISFYGSVPGLGFCKPPTAVQLRSSSTGNGYWIATRDGRILRFGDAAGYGDSPELSADTEILDLAISR
ncbi:MAG: hypothetical protein ACC652_08685 [Acidimicrobiales bacterium]